MDDALDAGRRLGIDPALLADLREAHQRLLAINEKLKERRARMEELRERGR